MLNAQTDPVGVPRFHHLHLNSTNPEAAIAFYTRQFPSTSKITFAGAPPLKSPNNVLVLFTEVNAPPPLQPQTAIWHFGWHVTDVRKNMESYKRRPEVKLLPLYTTDEGGSVFVSSDTWPGTGGVLGLTKAQISEAIAKGVQPAGGAGFAYLQGPDGAIIEYQGNMPAERFNHVHMYWEEPFCAQLWYQKHLKATIGGGGSQYTEANCKVPRGPDKTWPTGHAAPGAAGPAEREAVQLPIILCSHGFVMPRNRGVRRQHFTPTKGMAGVAWFLTAVFAGL